MPSVSSLLRSAQATQKKIRAQEDALVAFEWESSQQTYDDFVAYSKYLQDRAQNVTDPGENLTYQTKLRSANRSYTSNEIQRAQQQIMQGGGTTLDKMGAIKSLYDRAVANGDFNLAQNLLSQWDTTSIAYQNEQVAKQNYAGQLSTLRAEGVDDALDTLKTYVKDLGDIYRQDPQGFANNPDIQAWAKEAGVKGESSFWNVFANLADKAVQTVQGAISAEDNPSTLRTLQKKLQNLTEGNVFELPKAGGGSINVSLQDIKDQIDAARVGESVFNQTSDGFIKQKKTGFVWGRDENGQYRQIPLYNTEADYTSNVESKQPKFDSKGNIIGYTYLDAKNNPVAFEDLKTGKVTGLGGKNVGDARKYNYKELLQSANLQTYTRDGQLYLKNTGNIPGFYGSPFPTGSDLLLEVGPNGELITRSGDNAYQIEFDNQGNIKGLGSYQPSAITQVNGSTGRFNNRFLATQDLTRFTPDINSLVGIVDESLMNRYRTSIASLTGVTGGALGNTPITSLLSNAGNIQAANTARFVQPPTPAPVVQPPAPIIQSRPVNPFALPPVPQLKVTNSPPPQNIVNTSVARPTQQITSVGTARPQSGLVVR